MFPHCLEMSFENGEFEGKWVLGILVGNFDNKGDGISLFYVYFLRFDKEENILKDI